MIGKVRISNSQMMQEGVAKSLCRSQEGQHDDKVGTTKSLRQFGVDGRHWHFLINYSHVCLVLFVKDAAIKQLSGRRHVEFNAQMLRIHKLQSRITEHVSVSEYIPGRVSTNARRPFDISRSTSDDVSRVGWVVISVWINCAVVQR